MKKALHELTDALTQAKRIGLIMHISPDGDTCGSALALCRALILLKKKARVICDNPVPQIYADLVGADGVIAAEAVDGADFDLLVAVDVGDGGRLGQSRGLFEAAERTAQIDHHGTNPNYAQINYIRTPLCATGVLVGEVIDSLGVPFDREIAKCLYVAIATDTGNFKQRNTDAEALRVAARCIEAGADPAEISRRVFSLRPLCQNRLLGRALIGMTLYAQGRIAVMALRKGDFEESGALQEHTEGIVNFAIDTEGVEIACLLSETDTRIKCSLRSLPPYDVARIASGFGGGGHGLAAGCLMRPPMETTQSRLVAAMMEELERGT